MYRQHFGLTSQPLGKDTQELWDDGPIAALKERFQWLLENPGVALLTGDPGVGKTSALRLIADGLNPHRYQVIYMAETDFGRMDLYRQLGVTSLPLPLSSNPNIPRTFGLLSETSPYLPRHK
jgi:MSHA biogenesis protein MshM